MMGTLENWGKPTENLFNDLKTFTISTVIQILQSEEFQRWNGCGLFEKARQVIESFVQNKFDEAKGQAQHLMELETIGDVVYSDANKYAHQQSIFDFIMEKHLKDLQKSRYEARAKAKYLETYPQFKESVTKGEEPSIQKMMDKIDKPDFKEKVGVDPFNREIIVMAKMEAYYQYASSRFVELVVMTMQKEVLAQLKDVEYWLKSELHLEDGNGK
jgi:hypothetical protein